MSMSWSSRAFLRLSVRASTSLVIWSAVAMMGEMERVCGRLWLMVYRLYEKQRCFIPYDSTSAMLGLDHCESR